MTPDALGPLLAMAYATTLADAHNLAAAAVMAGATGAEAKAAVEQWQQMQARAVQTVRSSA
jgi:hypothetical protein